MLKKPIAKAAGRKVGRPPAVPADARVATTLRLDPADLEALKIMAAKQRVRVNDLLLEGVAYVLSAHRLKT
jgi:hypothetical protein